MSSSTESDNFHERLHVLETKMKNAVTLSKNEKKKLLALTKAPKIEESHNVNNIAFSADHDTNQLLARLNEVKQKLDSLHNNNKINQQSNAMQFSLNSVSVDAAKNSPYWVDF